MSARSDLHEVATVLAAQARASAGDGASLTGAEVAADLARGAKAALEAAALVDAEPAPIVAALERLDQRVDIGALAALEVGGPAAAIDAATDLIDELRHASRVNAAAAQAYTDLRSLLLNLQQTFTSAQSETSLRLAARIHLALEETQRALDAAAEQTEEMAHV